MTTRINLSIDEAKLAQLILDGHLCAADLHLLDSESKQKVWQLCLWCCKKRTQCQHHACTKTCVPNLPKERQIPIVQEVNK